MNLTAMEQVPAAVDRLLADAIGRRASDVHVEPGRERYDVRFRVDGLLETACTLDPIYGRAVVTRLMVLAHLLTYRQDIPQEGRMRLEVATLRRDGTGSGGLPIADRQLPNGSIGKAAPAALDPARSEAGGVELRVSIIPTTHGLRAAVRLPADLLQPRTLAGLCLPDAVFEGLQRFAAAEAGMLLVCGPAGSGKTTTIYALLEHIVATSPGVSVISLEDPVERDLPGITQIEVRPHGELTYARALRSILRQDPQVLMLGEIRDAETASLAVQAALSGHRLIATLHAATAGGAIARLLEMRLEPYQISSALWGVVVQRLLRRRRAEGGYAGRLPVAELAVMDSALRRALLDQTDADGLQALVARQPQFTPLAEAAKRLVAEGITDEAEVRRVLGVG